MAHAGAARARHIAGQRITHEGGRRRGDSESRERTLENARIGLRAPDLGRIDEDLKEGLNTGIVAYTRQVSVEVGHDTESIAAGQLAQQGDVPGDIRQRIVNKSSGHGSVDRVVGQPERLGHPRGEARDGLLERGRRWDGTDQRVIGLIEGGVEALPSHRGAGLEEQAVHALLPGEPVGIQRSPEVEQHRSRLVRDQESVPILTMYMDVYGGGGGNRTHVRKPSAAGVYVDSRSTLLLSRPAILQSAGSPRGQPQKSRPSPEARFGASHQSMTPVPGP